MPTSAARGPMLALGLAVLSGCPQGQDALATDTAVSTTGTSAPPASTGTTAVDPTDALSSTTAADVASTGGGSGGAGDSTASAPTCGDGHLDEGEECDLGLALNRDDGPCTQQCRLAYCGDGLVHVGEEACDLGDQNNDAVYGGCSVTCELGPRCGDELVQGPEECDLGPDEGAGTNEHGVACTGCRFHARLVFVTAAPTSAKIGGLAQADATCQTAALAAGLDNSSGFIAWLSDVDDAAADRLAGGANEPERPFVQRNGVPIADDLDALLDDGPQGGIVVTETGAPLLSVRVWTNTDLHGEVFDAATSCGGWTSSSAELFGRAGMNWVSEGNAALHAAWLIQGGWTSFSTEVCNLKAHLYCFEL